ncbi:MAG: FkbM family methyltransferase [Acidimicrobiales bacterium]|nr:FkbM family methyltransferase [Acidimicrobiales bacterium]
MLSRPLLRAVELVRRHNGYAVPRTGARLHEAVRRSLPERADVELLPGVRTELDLRQPVELQSWWQGGRYEHPTTQRLDDWSATASAFFDIGANYGFFTLRAHHAGCPEVHAFEPNPVLHERLSATVARNGLGGVRCHNLGLGDSPSRLALQVREADLGHSSFGPRTWDDGHTVTVDVVTFDGWRASAGLDLPQEPRWVAKIDVEGYERRVLEGMVEALGAAAFQAVVVELNELTLQSCGTSAADVVSLLAASGYVNVDGGAVPRSGADQRVRNGFFVPAGARDLEVRE